MSVRPLASGFGLAQGGGEGGVVGLGKLLLKFLRLEPAHWRIGEEYVSGTPMIALEVAGNHRLERRILGRWQIEVIERLFGYLGTAYRFLEKVEKGDIEKGDILLFQA